MTWFSPDELVALPIGKKADIAYNLKNDPGEIGSTGARGSITEHEATLLSEYANGKKVLEIGTGTGYSAFRMASRAASVTTVDIDLFVVEKVFPRLEALGIRCYTEVPDEIFEMVFIDGNHSETSVADDYARTIDKLKRPGKMFFHDLHMLGVRRALNKLALKPEKLGTALSLGFVEFHE